MRMDSLVCICGEMLTAEQSEKGEKELGNLAKLYESHMIREDHRLPASQWIEAYDRIQAAKEAAKAK